MRTATALVRVALELRPNSPATWRRLGSTPWLARDPEVLDALAALAETADKLAVTEPLPSSEAVRSKLAEVAEGTPLATLPADQRLTLAARASTNAAASARLELYSARHGRRACPGAEPRSALGRRSHAGRREKAHRCALPRGRTAS